MFGMVLEKLKKKIGVKVIKNFVYVFVVSLIYFIIGLINFTDASVDFSALRNVSYWVKYTIVVATGLVMMFIAIAMRKDKLRSSNIITDQENAIRAYKVALIDRDLYYDFKDNYLRKRNKEEKLSEYRSRLIAKRDRAKRQSAIDKYDTELKLTESQGFDIDCVRVFYKPITVNTIFSGFAEKKTNGTVHYSGLEHLAQKVLPTLAFGVFWSALLLCLNLTPHATTFNQWKDMATLVMATATYFLRGWNYGEFSVNTVYYSVLENRKGEIRRYLKEKDLSCIITDNANYKYLAEITEKDVEVSE